MKWLEAVKGQGFSADLRDSVARLGAPQYYADNNSALCVRVPFLHRDFTPYQEKLAELVSRVKASRAGAESD
jgi:hypothetical protein